MANSRVFVSRGEAMEAKHLADPGIRLMGFKRLGQAGRLPEALCPLLVSHGLPFAEMNLMGFIYIYIYMFPLLAFKGIDFTTGCLFQGTQA